MKYSDTQANAKAEQIYERFGSQIHLVCSNSIVPETFLGGFTGVEAGVNRHSGLIDPEATRFEQHVYQRLLAVRDGLLSSYQKIRRESLAGISDAGIRNLATSWGLTQIMGWHMIHNLKGTVEDLRDPDKHLYYTVQLLVLTARPYIERKDFGSVLRIWNAGSANGKTFDPDYVYNALRVKKFYEKISAAEPLEIPPAVGEPFSSSANEPAAEPASQPAQPPNIPLPPVASSLESDPAAVVPAGDPPDAQPTKWFNVEDWKPLVFRWLKRIWGGNLTANAGQTFANLVGAVKDPEHWYIYVAVAAGVLILLVGAGMLVSLPLIVLWLWNRREILHLKAAQFAALADPNMKNIGLLFEKK